jgi:hypothetical protein
MDNYSLSYTRRSNTQPEVERVAITDVDPATRTAHGLTRVRTRIKVNCAYATGDTITVPAVGEQWYVERVDMEWRLRGRIPFNDATLSIEPEEGQVSVGSASGPLELNGTEVRANGRVLRLNGVYYRDSGETLERSEDGQTGWQPIFANASGNGTGGVLQMLANSLADIEVTPAVEEFLAALTAEEAQALDDLAEWADGLASNAFGGLCDNDFFSDLRGLGTGTNPLDEIGSGFQNFMNGLVSLLFCQYSIEEDGNVTPTVLAAQFGDLQDFFTGDNPVGDFLRGLQGILPNLDQAGDLLRDSVQGAVKFVQDLFDIFFCGAENTPALEPGDIIGQLQSIFDPLKENKFLLGLQDVVVDANREATNLFRDALEGTVQVIQNLFDALFCDFDYDPANFTPTLVFDQLQNSIIAPLRDNPVIKNLTEFAERMGDQIRSGPNLAFDGKFNFTNVARFRVNPAQTSGYSEAPRDSRHKLFTFAGTATPDVSMFQAIMGIDVDPEVWEWVPVIYPHWFPVSSSVETGVQNCIEAINAWPGKFGLSGYSQGAIVCSSVLWELRFGSLQHRYADLIGAVMFGNPKREAGVTFPGGINPGGAGMAPDTGGPNGRIQNTPALWWEFANHNANDPANGLVAIPGSLGSDPFTVNPLTAAGEWITAIYQFMLQEFNGSDADLLPRLQELFSPQVLTSAGNAIQSIIHLFKGFGVGHMEYGASRPLPGSELTSCELGVQHLNAVGRAAALTPQTTGGGGPGRSWNWTHIAGAKSGLKVAPNPQVEHFIVSPGDTYFLEGEVMPFGGNADAGAIQIGATLSDTTGVRPVSEVFLGYPQGGAGMLPGKWNRIKTSVAIPAGYNRAVFSIRATESVQNGDRFWVDDVAVRRNTNVHPLVAPIEGLVELGQTLFGLLSCDLPQTKIDNLDEFISQSTGGLLPNMLDFLQNRLFRPLQGSFVSGLADMFRASQTFNRSLLEDSIAGAEKLIEVIYDIMTCNVNEALADIRDLVGPDAVGVTPAKLVTLLDDLFDSFRANPFVIGLETFWTTLGNQATTTAQDAIRGANEFLETVFNVLLCKPLSVTPSSFQAILNLNEAAAFTPAKVIQNIHDFTSFFGNNPFIKGLQSFWTTLGNTGENLIKDAVQGASKFFEYITDLILCKPNAGANLTAIKGLANTGTGFTPAKFVADIDGFLDGFRNNDFLKGLEDFWKALGNTSENLLDGAVQGASEFFDFLFKVITCNATQADLNSILGLANSETATGVTPAALVKGIDDFFQPFKDNNFLTGLQSLLGGDKTNNLIRDAVDGAVKFAETVFGLLTCSPSQPGPLISLSSLAGSALPGTSTPVGILAALKKTFLGTGLDANNQPQSGLLGNDWIKIFTGIAGRQGYTGNLLNNIADGFASVMDFIFDDILGGLFPLQNFRGILEDFPNGVVDWLEDLNLGKLLDPSQLVDWFKKNVFSPVFTAITGVVDDTLEFFQNPLQHITQFFTNVRKFFGEGVIGDWLDNFGENGLLSGNFQPFKAIQSFIENMLGNTSGTNVLKTLWDTLVDGLTDASNNFIRALTGRPIIDSEGNIIETGFGAGLKAIRDFFAGFGFDPANPTGLLNTLVKQITGGDGVLDLDDLKNFFDPRHAGNLFKDVVDTITKAITGLTNPFAAFADSPLKALFELFDPANAANQAGNFLKKIVDTMINTTTISGSGPLAILSQLFAGITFSGTTPKSLLTQLTDQVSELSDALGINSIVASILNVNAEDLVNSYNLTVTGSPTGGTFRLSYGGTTTGPITYSTSAGTTAANIDAALAGLTITGATAELGSAAVTVTNVDHSGGVRFLVSLTEKTGTLTLHSASLTGGTSPAVAVAQKFRGGIQSLQSFFDGFGAFTGFSGSNNLLQQVIEKTGTDIANFVAKITGLDPAALANPLEALKSFFSGFSGFSWDGTALTGTNNLIQQIVGKITGGLTDGFTELQRFFTNIRSLFGGSNNWLAFASGPATDTTKFSLQRAANAFISNLLSQATAAANAFIPASVLSNLGLDKITDLVKFITGKTPASTGEHGDFLKNFFAGLNGTFGTLGLDSLVSKITNALTGKNVASSLADLKAFFGIGTTGGLLDFSGNNSLPIVNQIVKAITGRSTSGHSHPLADIATFLGLGDSADLNTLNFWDGTNTFLNQLVKKITGDAGTTLAHFESFFRNLRGLLGIGSTAGLTPLADLIDGAFLTTGSKLADAASRFVTNFLSKAGTGTAAVTGAIAKIPATILSNLGLGQINDLIKFLTGKDPAATSNAGTPTDIQTMFTNLRALFAPATGENHLLKGAFPLATAADEFIKNLLSQASTALTSFIPGHALGSIPVLKLPDLMKLLTGSSETGSTPQGLATLNTQLTHFFTNLRKFFGVGATAAPGGSVLNLLTSSAHTVQDLINNFINNVLSQATAAFKGDLIPGLSFSKINGLISGLTGKTGETVDSDLTAFFTNLRSVFNIGGGSGQINLLPTTAFSLDTAKNNLFDWVSTLSKTVNGAVNSFLTNSGLSGWLGIGTSTTAHTELQHFFTNLTKFFKIDQFKLSPTGTGAGAFNLAAAADTFIKDVINGASNGLLNPAKILSTLGLNLDGTPKGTLAGDLGARPLLADLRTWLTTAATDTTEDIQRFFTNLRTTLGLGSVDLKTSILQGEPLKAAQTAIHSVVAAVNNAVTDGTRWVTQTIADAKASVDGIVRALLGNKSPTDLSAYVDLSGITNLFSPLHNTAGTSLLDKLAKLINNGTASFTEFFSGFNGVTATASSLIHKLLTPILGTDTVGGNPVARTLTDLTNFFSGFNATNPNPAAGSLAHRIAQTLGGATATTLTQVQHFFANLRTFLGINDNGGFEIADFFSNATDFANKLTTGIDGFIKNILKRAGVGTNLVTLVTGKTTISDGIIPPLAIDKIENLISSLTGSGTTVLELQRFFTNLRGLFGSTNWLTPAAGQTNGFNLVTAANQFVTNVLSKATAAGVGGSLIPADILTSFGVDKIANLAKALTGQSLGITPTGDLAAIQKFFSGFTGFNPDGTTPATTNSLVNQITNSIFGANGTLANLKTFFDGLIPGGAENFNTTTGANSLVNQITKALTGKATGGTLTDITSFLGLGAVGDTATFDPFNGVNTFVSQLVKKITGDATATQLNLNSLGNVFTNLRTTLGLGGLDLHTATATATTLQTNIFDVIKNFNAGTGANALISQEKLREWLNITPTTQLPALTQLNHFFANIKTFFNGNDANGRIDLLSGPIAIGTAIDNFIRGVVNKGTNGLLSANLLPELDITKIKDLVTNLTGKTGAVVANDVKTFFDNVRLMFNHGTTAGQTNLNAAQSASTLQNNLFDVVAKINTELGAVGKALLTNTGLTTTLGGTVVADIKKFFDNIKLLLGGPTLIPGAGASFAASDEIGKLFPLLSASTTGLLAPAKIATVSAGTGTLVQDLTARPILTELTSWLTTTGTSNNIQKFFSNLQATLGGPALLPTTFDAAAKTAAQQSLHTAIKGINDNITVAANKFATEQLANAKAGIDSLVKAITGGTGTYGDLSRLTSFFEDLGDYTGTGTTLINQIVNKITGGINQNLTNLGTFFGNFQSMFSGINLNSGTFNLSNANNTLAKSLLGNSKLIPKLNNYQLSISGAPTSGSYRLSYDGQVTDNIPFDATSLAIQSALTGLTTIGAGDAEVSGSLADGFTITINDLADELQVFSTALVGGVDAAVSLARKIDSGMMPQVSVDDVTDIEQWGHRSVLSPIVSTLRAATGENPDEEDGLTALGAWASKLLTGDSRVPAENLDGTIDNALLGVIPVASISNSSPNLLTQGGFTVATNLDAGDGWTWDESQSRTGSDGSAKLAFTAAGTKELFSGQSIPVAENDNLTLSAYVRTTGIAEGTATYQVVITGSPTAGTFRLTYGGQTTSSLAHNAPLAAVQDALADLTTIGAGNVSVASGTPGVLYGITINNLNSALTATSSLTGPRTYTLSINGSPIAGAFALGWNGSITGDLQRTASASTIQSALTGFPSIGGSGATVASAGTGRFTVAVSAPSTLTATSSLTSRTHALSITNTPTSGGWAFTYGADTSASVAHTATLAEVQAALVGLPGVTAATVTGTPGSSYSIWLDNQNSTLGVVPALVNATSPGSTVTPVAGTTPAVTVTGTGPYTVTQTGSPVGGTYTLTYGGRTIASGLSPTAAPGLVQSALQALTTAPGATVSGTAASYTVTIPQSLTAANVSLTGTAPSVAVTGTDPFTVSLAGATGGNFTLTFNGQTTGQLAWNATTTQVRDALALLGTVNGSTRVTVTGTAGSSYTVTITSTLTATSSLTDADHTVALTGAPTGGTWRLSYGSATSGPIAHNATAAAVQGVLEQMAGVGTGNVTVTGTAPTWTVSFRVPSSPLNATPAVNANELFNATSPRATLTSSTVATTLKAAGRYSVAVSGSPAAGAYRLSYGGVNSAEIAYDDGAAAIQAKLAAMTSIGAGNVVVSGSPASYTVAIGNYAGGLAVASSTLVSATYAAVTVTDGFRPPGGSSIFATITDGSPPNGGTYSLGYAGHTIASSLAYNAPITTVQNALDALPPVDAITASGSNAVFTLTFSNTKRTLNVTDDFVSLTSLTPSATLTEQPLVNAVAGGAYTLALSGSPTGGSFRLSYGGAATGDIAHNATAATIQAALQSLPTIGTGRAGVTGTAASANIAITGETSTLAVQRTALTGGSSPRVVVTDTARPLTLSLVPFSGTTQLSTAVLAAARPGTAWTQISGGLTVPAGTTSVRTRLAFGGTATSGSAWFDDVSLTKTGLLNQSLVDRLREGWQGLWDGVFGTGGADKTSDDLREALGFVSGTASNGVANAAAADGKAQTIADGVEEAMTGSAPVGGAAPGAVKTHLQGLNLNLFGQNFLGTELQLPAIPDIPVGKSLDMRGIFNNVVLGLQGKTSTDVGGTGLPGLDDIFKSAKAANDAITTLGQAVAGLQTSATNTSNSGKSDFTDFAAFTPFNNGTGLLYAGTSTSALVSSGGQAVWQTNGQGTRWAQGVLTRTATNTNWQKVGIAFGSGPEADWITNGNPAFNYILGRANNTYTASGGTVVPRGQHYVFAKFSKTGFTVGYTTNGTATTPTETLFPAPAGGWPYAHEFTPGAVYYLECGTDAGQTVYRVSRNGTPLLTLPATAAYPYTDADHRFSGFKAQATATLLYTNKPGSMAAFAVTDNTPAEYIGSGFRRFRSSTSATAIARGDAGGYSLLPSDFFNGTSYATPDYSYTTTTDVPNKITVDATGWYQVTTSLALGNQSMLTELAPTLYKNGVLNARGGSVWGLPGFPARGPSQASATFTVYLQEGEYIQPGYWQNPGLTGTNGYASGNWVGDSNGVTSYIQVAFLNRSTAN